MVWTDKDVILWGGSGDIEFFNTGVRFQPISDRWLRVSESNAPSARCGHSTIWTGKRMIIWGGYERSSNPLGLMVNTGGGMIHRRIVGNRWEASIAPLLVRIMQRSGLAQKW